MFNYRDIFYKRYFSSQVGKSDPSSFSALFNEQKWFFSHEIIPLLPKNKTVSILDIGCGIGSLLAALKANGYNTVKGIDVSPEQVELAHALGVKEVILGNLNDYIKEQKEVFDVITGMDIIEHFSKDELSELILNLKGLLKAGGMLIFRTPNMDSPLSSVFSYGDFTHECLLNKSSALQLMKSCGYPLSEVLPSMLKLNNPLKEMLRKLLWWGTVVNLKIQLFSSARTWHNVVFTPNIIIIGRV